MDALTGSHCFKRLRNFDGVRGKGGEGAPADCPRAKACLEE